MARTRLLALIALSVAVAGLALGAGARGGRPAAALPSPSARSTLAARPAVSLASSRSALATVSWRGGPVTTAAGQVVRVFVSNTLPVETATPEQWAEFLASLTHGSELEQLTSYIAPLAEVQQICGPRTLGCYLRNELVSMAEPIADGTTAEEVVRHEYGHHIALHRSNDPWMAIDWGPKWWASAVGVCGRVARREAFPGDEGTNYSRNPGEAWSEVYRLMDERKAGITTANWQIIDPGFYPGDAALQAAERDVLEPWAQGTPVAFRKVFGAKTKVWLIPLRTPLDGEMRVTAVLPRNGLQEVALLGPDRRAVIRKGQWFGQRSKTLSTTVCGQRTLYVRVTQRGAPGLVRLSVTTP